MQKMTVSDLVNNGTEQLKEKRIFTPRLDCELILAYLMGEDRKFLYMHPGCIVEPGVKNRFYKLIEERTTGMPVQYITGHQEFMGLDFSVNRSVLIPRPDTEVLVETVIEWLRMYPENSKPVAVDVGTGSGAIAVSLAYYCPHLQMIAIEVSQEAMEVARRNADKNGVGDRINFVEGDLLHPLKGLGMHNNIDVIISNPPYIPSEAIKNLQKEVKLEPVTALDGGEDGLAFYRRLAAEAPLFLIEGGLLALEIGYNQVEDVTNIIDLKNNFSCVKVVKDLAQRDRVIIATAV